MKNNLVKNVVILFIITLISGLLLGLFYEITKEPIKVSKEETLNKSYKKVLSDFDHYEDVTDDILGASAGLQEYAYLKFAYKVFDKNNNYIGSIVCAESNGYGGKVKILVGFDTNKIITGIAFPEMLQETPGLGMKVADEKFYSQYIGKEADSFEIVKNNLDKSNSKKIDAVTGATFSSKAVNNCVNTCCGFARRIN